MARLRRRCGLMTELGDCYTWSLSGTTLDSLAELHSQSTFFPKSKFAKKKGPKVTHANLLLSTLLFGISSERFLLSKFY